MHSRCSPGASRGSGQARACGPLRSPSLSLARPLCLLARCLSWPHSIQGLGTPGALHVRRMGGARVDGTLRPTGDDSGAQEAAVASGEGLVLGYSAAEPWALDWDPAALGPLPFVDVPGALLQGDSYQTPRLAQVSFAPHQHHQRRGWPPGWGVAAVEGLPSSPTPWVPSPAPRERNKESSTTKSGKSHPFVPRFPQLQNGRPKCLSGGLGIGLGIQLALNKSPL